MCLSDQYQPEEGLYECLSCQRDYESPVGSVSPAQCKKNLIGSIESRAKRMYKDEDGPEYQTDYLINVHIVCIVTPHHIDYVHSQWIGRILFWMVNFLNLKFTRPSGFQIQTPHKY